MTRKLEGKIALITGAANGMGLAAAKLFTREGARVMLADIEEEAGQSAASAIGALARFIKLDVSSEEQWKYAAEKLQSDFGGVDILINNAGIVHAAPLLDVPLADFERLLSINLIGAWLGMKTLAPIMIARGGGSIVNNCSTSALWGMNGVSIYGATKWALRGLTKNAAMELAPQGVRVNAVFPGGINTRLGNITQEPIDDVNKKYYGNYPIPRIGEPSEVAQAMLFLASDESRYCVGAEISVDGGMTIGQYNDFLPGTPQR